MNKVLDQTTTTEATNVSTTITFELPGDIVALLGPPEGIADKVRELLVLDLLRRAEISQGLAARLLGITRWDILQPMARDQIPSGPLTAEDARRDIENARIGSRFAADAGS